MSETSDSFKGVSNPVFPNGNHVSMEEAGLLPPGAPGGLNLPRVVEAPARGAVKEVVRPNDCPSKTLG
jgi:hypothetical protein